MAGLGVSAFFRKNKAFKYASSGDTYNLSQYLADFPAVVNAKGSGGFTCLHGACMKGNLDMVMMLLLRGADINAADKNGFTALLISIEKGHGLVAATLVERGASVTARKKSTNCTPLHIAAQHNCTMAVPALIDYGADLNAVNKRGDTPLHIALKENHADVALMLVERRADATIKNKDGVTATELAQQTNFAGMLSMMDIQHHMDSEAKEEVKKKEKKKEKDKKKKKVKDDGKAGGAEESAMKGVGAETDTAQRKGKTSTKNAATGSITDSSAVTELGGDDVNVRCWGPPRSSSSSSLVSGPTPAERATDNVTRNAAVTSRGVRRVETEEDLPRCGRSSIICGAPVGPAKKVPPSLAPPPPLHPSVMGKKDKGKPGKKGCVVM